MRPELWGGVRRSLASARSSPGPAHGNAPPFGDPDVCIHAPPLRGRCCSGSSFSSPGIQPLPCLVFVWRPLARLPPAQRGWLIGAAAPEVELGLEYRPAEAGWDAAGAMLGKDYMLAIILVNCDGVHGGAWWED